MDAHFAHVQARATVHAHTQAHTHIYRDTQYNRQGLYSVVKAKHRHTPCRKFPKLASQTLHTTTLDTKGGAALDICHQKNVLAFSK